MSQAISSVEPSWRTSLVRRSVSIRLSMKSQSVTTPGPMRTQRVGALDAQHRAGVGVAKVVQAEVVGDGVTGDVVRGVGVGDVAGRARR